MRALAAEVDEAVAALKNAADRHPNHLLWKCTGITGETKWSRLSSTTSTMVILPISYFYNLQVTANYVFFRKRQGSPLAIFFSFSIYVCTKEQRMTVQVTRLAKPKKEKEYNIISYSLAI
jgi:hypothetical protein